MNNRLKSISNIITGYNKRRKENKEFDSRFEYIDQHYPGVHEFLIAAKEWAHDIQYAYDPKLYRLLRSLNGKKSILDLTDSELRRIYRFLVKRGVEDYESAKEMFINATGEEDEI